VDRVGRDVSVGAAEVDGHYDQVVNVLHVVADLGLGEVFGGGVADDDVAGGAVKDFVAGEGLEVELTVGPFDFDLGLSSQKRNRQVMTGRMECYPLRLQIDIITLRPRKKLRSTFHERHSGSPLAHPDAHQLSTLDDGQQVAVGRAIGQAGEVQRATLGTVGSTHVSIHEL